MNLNNFEQNKKTILDILDIENNFSLFYVDEYKDGYVENIITFKKYDNDISIEYAINYNKKDPLHTKEDEFFVYNDIRKIDMFLKYKSYFKNFNDILLNYYLNKKLTTKTTTKKAIKL